MGAESAVVLSVVLRVVGGAQAVRRCLSRLVPQTTEHPIEVIVPYDRTVREVQALSRDFPSVRFVELSGSRIVDAHGRLVGAHELYDRRTAAGLAVARGEILALLEDYGAPAADWCDQVLLAHRLPYEVIGGAVELERGGALNQAVYLQDFARYRRPLAEGPANYLTDVNVSYKRSALYAVRSLWQAAYNEVTVHWALRRRGATLWRRPQMVVYQDRGCLALRALARERFEFGRVFGRKRVAALGPRAALLYTLGAPALPGLLLFRTAREALRRPRDWASVCAAMPALAVLTAFWCAGEGVAYAEGTMRALAAWRCRRAHPEQQGLLTSTHHGGLEG